MPHWDFDTIVNDAKSKWNEELGVIDAELVNDNVKTTFYTALYHTMLAPVLYSDVDGSYRGNDYLIHQRGEFENYHIYPLWETFRAAYPLFTITQQQRMSDILSSIINIVSM